METIIFDLHIFHHTNTVASREIKKDMTGFGRKKVDIICLELKFNLRITGMAKSGRFPTLRFEDDDGHRY
jgi:hypothetical protein